MRSLLKLLLPGVFLTLTYGDIQAQTDVDTIDLSETVLEERHLRYMYNYALNAALFQYEGGSPTLTTHNDHFFENDKILQIITNEREVDVSMLDRFVLPRGFCYLNYIQDAHPLAMEWPLNTQYILEYVPESDRKQIYKLLEEETNSIFAVEFSSLFENRSSFFLELTINIRLNYPVLFGRSFVYFEFQWCDSKQVVFPVRTNTRALPSPEIHFLISPPFEIKGRQVRRSPTIDIPAKECRILK